MFGSTARAYSSLLMLIVCLHVNTGRASDSNVSQLEQALDRLKSASLQERRKAAESVYELLNEMEPASPEQIETSEIGNLLKRIAKIIQDKQEDSEVRTNLVHSVKYCQALPVEAAKTFVNVALDETDDADVRCTIIMILRGLVPDDVASRTIVRATESPDWGVRANAFQQLVGLQLPGDEMLKIVERGINDPNAGVRMMAVDQTLFLAKTESRALPLVIQALNDADEGVRSKTLTILPHSEINSAALTAELENLLTSNDSPSRIHAAMALMMTSKDVSKHLDVVTKELSSDEARIRGMAAQSLYFLGPRAKAATDDLTTALNDKDVNVRVQAANSLSKITGDPKPYIDVLVDGLRTGDEQARMWAAGFLGFIADEEKDLVKQRLLDVAKADDPEARAAALPLLFGLGAHAEMIDVAVSALEDEDARVRISALTALSVTEQLAREERVLNKVQSLTTDEDQNVRKTAESVIRMAKSGDESD